MHKQNQTGHTRIARENGLATINRGVSNMENMKKSNEKKQEKGMNRTEFAQEYSMDHCKSNGKQAEKQQKTKNSKA